MADSIEIIVHSTIPSQPGRISVLCNEDQTVENIIEAFCKEKQIPIRKEFVLRNARKESLRRNQLLSVASVTTGDVLYLETNESSKYIWCCGCNHWWLLGALAVLVSCVGLTVILVLKCRNTNNNNWGIVIDAGSEHTQLYLYNWNMSSIINGTAVVQQVDSCYEGKGIASYAYDPLLAGNLLERCLQEASAKVPSSSLSRSLIYLGATAGMRLLREINFTGTEAIMSAVRDTIAKYPFNFSKPLDQVKILEGEEEGAFGWVTANFLYGSFGQYSVYNYLSSWFYTSPTVGTLDLGGASTQISFIPKDPSSLAEKDRQDMLLFGSNYHVYTHSYLCYGLNEANRQHRAQLVRHQNFNETVIDPCLPKGSEKIGTYDGLFSVPCTLAPGDDTSVLQDQKFRFIGSSNDSACRQAIRDIFNFSAKCEKEPCTFNGVYQPPVHGNFLAFAGYYYVMKFLNLTLIPNFTLADLKYASNSYCNKTLTEINEIPMDSYQKKNALNYCFQSQYLITLLTAYGFNESNWHTISFVKKVNNADVGWTVGLMLNASNVISTSKSPAPINAVLFTLLAILFAICGILAIGFFYQARKTRKQVELYRRLNSFASTTSA